MCVCFPIYGANGSKTTVPLWAHDGQTDRQTERQRQADRDASNRHPTRRPCLVLLSVCLCIAPCSPPTLRVAPCQLSLAAVVVHGGPATWRNSTHCMGLL